MLTLNINESRTLEFEVQLSGINPDQLKGSLRFEVNNVEYGFPAEFKNETVVVNIPPLNSIISDKLSEGTKLRASLEANGNGYLLTPWSGEFVVSSPVKMEAKIMDIKEEPKVDVKLVSDDIDRLVEEQLIKNSKPPEVKKTKTIPPKISKKYLEEITKDQIFQFMSYMGTKTERIQTLLYEQAEQTSKTDDLKDIFKEVYKALKRK
jgi:hypothetical protein